MTNVDPFRRTTTTGGLAEAAGGASCGNDSGAEEAPGFTAGSSSSEAVSADRQQQLERELAEVRGRLQEVEEVKRVLASHADALFRLKVDFASFKAAVLSRAEDRGAVALAIEDLERRQEALALHIQAVDGHIPGVGYRLDRVEAAANEALSLHRAWPMRALRRLGLLVSSLRIKQP